MKLLPLTLQIDQAALSVSVTAAAGSAGTAIPDTRQTTLVAVSNQATRLPIEYQVGSGPWVLLANGDRFEAAINLATTTIKLRQYGPIVAVTPVLVEMDVLTGSFAAGANAYPGMSLALALGAVTVAAPPSSLAITGAPASTAAVSVPYYATFAATGGEAPYSYTVASGTLPDGLALDPISGAISGTPTTAGPSGGLSVRATDALNYSTTSSTFSIVTTGVSVVAPGAPTGAVATAGNAQATINFSAPASNGGAAITGYTATSSPGALTGTVSGAAAAPITVTGLTNGTAYTFTVRATNSVGTSAASTATAAVTPAAGNTVPGPPTALTLGTPTATTQPLTWTAPASNGGAAITDYVVQRALAGSGTWTTFADGTSTTPSATVTGLTASTGYDYRVAAVNSVGTGSFSATVTGSTAAVVVADTRPRFWYSTATTYTGGAAATPFGTATKFGSNASPAGTFAPTAPNTSYVWVAILASSAPTGVTFNDGSGVGGFQGGDAPAGDYLAVPPNVNTTPIQHTDSTGVYDLYRSNATGVNSVTITTS